MKITIGNNKNINKAAVTEASEEVKAASEGKTELVKGAQAVPPHIQRRLQKDDSGVSR